MDLAGKAVEWGAKWAAGQFSCPQCKRFAGTTMHFNCCGNHICMPCFTNLRSIYKGQETARCPFCRGAIGLVCYLCEEYKGTQGNRCTTRCCNKAMCDACMDRYGQQAVEAAKRTGVLKCPICTAVIG